MLIQAAGRTFSRKNQERITALWTELGNLLIDSGLVGAADLTALFEDAKQEKPEAEGVGEEGTEVTEEVAAQGFTDEVKAITWFDAVKRSLDLFKGRFLALHRMSDAEIEKRYGVQTSRINQAEQMIAEMSQILKEQCGSFPGMIEPAFNHYPGAYIEPELPPLYAQAATETENQEVVEPTQEVQAETEPEPEPEVEEIQASEVDLTLVGVTEISAANQRGNRLPIEGVLFRVDEPSESAPAKGSKLPLYVPREVAELAAIAVNESRGLPIDVDDSLSKHSNEQIVGIYTEASVDGNDFVVRGHAFPWSQPERVRLISANKERLGMSMNAHAAGHTATVDGKKVFWVDYLELLGANILYSDRATYQQTRLLAAEIAASTNDVSDYEEIDVELEAQLKDLGETLKTVTAATLKDSEKVDTLVAEVQALRREVEEIQGERKEKTTALQAQAAQEAEQKRTESLVVAIANTFNERLEAQKNELIDLINPSRQPRRITQGLVSLTAQAGTQTEPQPGQINAKYVEFLQASAKLEGYREANYNGTDRVKLVEEVAQLKRELGIS